LHLPGTDFGSKLRLIIVLDLSMFTHIINRKFNLYLVERIYIRALPCNRVFAEGNLPFKSVVCYILDYLLINFTVFQLPLLMFFYICKNYCNSEIYH
jgi:hypothetical protein